MSLTRSVAILSILVLALAERLPAELPLPDATLYGTIATRDGTPVTQGALKARVRRGAATVLETAGGFRQADGVFWYVVQIPIETAIGAPGPSGAGAREGDTLEALLLDSTALELQAAVAPLRAGSATRVNAIATAAPTLRYVRGDCNADRALDIGDPLRILFLAFVTPAPPPCLEACDADGNEAVNLHDAVFLLSHLYLERPAPPAPGANCALDPSPSTLGCVQSPCPAGP